MLLLTVFAILLFLYIYRKINSSNNYWKEKSVFHIKPHYLFGNIKEVIFRQTSLTDVLDFLYYSNENVRYTGLYLCTVPVLMIRDLDIIKEIAIREFNSFPDRTMTISKESDPCWSHSLIMKSVKDGWTEARSRISHSFTSQKLRIMIPLMQKSLQNFNNFFKSNQGTVTLEMKDTFLKIFCDIITSVAFGVSVNSFKHPPNLFYVLGKKTANFNGLRALIMIGYLAFPRLLEFFRIRFFSNDIMNFFQNVIKETLNERREKNMFPPDFLHILTKTDDSNKQYKMSNDEITANSLVFFFAGLDSLSTTLSFVAYEFALNPDIQTRVYEDITKVLQSHDGNLTDESISDMKYLDSVISETLRLHSPNFAFDRKCLKSYTIEPKLSGELPLTIHKGMCIIVPIRAIHHDAKYFPDPLRFDPNRFNSENKTKIKTNSYIPFGVGPRHCIAARLAILTMKVVLIEITRHYEFLRIEKTEVPPTYRLDSIFKSPKNGVWVGLKPRT